MRNNLKAMLEKLHQMKRTINVSDLAMQSSYASLNVGYNDALKDVASLNVGYNDALKDVEKLLVEQEAELRERLSFLHPFDDFYGGQYSLLKELLGDS